MKRFLPVILVLLLLLTACSETASQDKASSAATMGTANPQTAATTVPAVSQSAVTSAPAVSTSPVQSSPSSAAETSAPRPTEPNADFLNGSWVCADREDAWRVEFFSETECALCHYPTDSDIDEILLGTYTIENDTLTVNGHDRLNDADLTVSFTIAGYKNEAAKYIDLTYLTTEHELFSLKTGEKLAMEWESGEFYLKDAEAPYACMQYGISDGDWQVELPLIMNADTEALQEINDILIANREYAEEMYENRDGSLWLEWESYLYQDENRIQILLVQNEYPVYGTDGTLVSWNYDRSTDEDTYVQVKISELGLSEETLLKAIENAAEQPIDINGAYTSAYLITDKNTVNFYYTVPQTPDGADTWLTFYTVSYDAAAKTCTASQGLLLP